MGNLYHSVQMLPLSVSERDLVSCLCRSRLDPRLLEVLTEHVRDFWWTKDPEILNRAAKRSAHPFMIKVAVNFVCQLCENDEATAQDFHQWMVQALRGIANPAPQFLFVGVVPLFSKSAQIEIDNCQPILKKLNLVSSVIPFNKQMPGRIKPRGFADRRIGNTDELKLKYVSLLKDYKAQNLLSNAEMINRSGINRVFLSRLLNNKFEKISVEYLESKVKALGLNIE